MLKLARLNKDQYHKLNNSDFLKQNKPKILACSLAKPLFQLNEKQLKIALHLLMFHCPQYTCVRNLYWTADSLMHLEWCHLVSLWSQHTYFVFQKAGFCSANILCLSVILNWLNTSNLIISNFILKHAKGRQSFCDLLLRKLILVVNTFTQKCKNLT